MGFHDRVRVQGGQTLDRRLHLGPADIGGGVEHLALQVRQRDGVGIHQADRSNPGGGQIQRGRRAQAPGPDHQHARALELLLARTADFAKHQMAGVALDLGF